MTKAIDMAELKSFFSGYFHEDWELDAQSSDEVIYNFLMSRTNYQYVNIIIFQIELYLDTEKNDSALERDLLDEFGCYYLPSADGMNVRNWLSHVADLLRKR